jgi:asparagine synthase (glutamine-hydrolysing)
MCGIAGFWGPMPNGMSPEELLRSLTDRVAHRGPDDVGTWVAPHGGPALGHRRLSILDTSAAGHQPMRSASGRFVVVFNGEIFNFRELRAKLSSETPFHTECDTEVLLAAVEIWGIERAVSEFVGMFAFALWDVEQHRLHLVRDRLGIKPLYYAQVAGALIFGSELGVVEEWPGLVSAVDPESVALLLRHNCIPSPRSILKGVAKLPTGCLLTLDAPTTAGVPIPFWSASSIASLGRNDRFAGSDQQAIDQLDELLQEVVGLRMISDVPLGAFLSGGIDSSLVVAVMQRLSDRPVRTFTIGSRDAAYDEAKQARSVARHLGTDHTEWILSEDDAIEAALSMPSIYDEPFADSSQIPTYLVSRLARKDVTVALSGDGGDELFGGYNRHAWADRILGLMACTPRSLRRGLGALSRRAPERAINTIVDRFRPVLPSFAAHRLAGQKLNKLGRLLEAGSPGDLYTLLRSHWTEPALALRKGAARPEDLPTLEGLSPAEQFMLWDLCTYLSDDVLAKVDRASMAVGLEVRVPLLDHRLVQFAWRLPFHMKVRGGRGKWILRQLLQRYLPREIIERPKMGFGVPLDSWLRGPLRTWAEALLRRDRLEDEGYFHADVVRRMWSAHLEGHANHQYEIWNVLMFQAWLERRSISSVCVAPRESMAVLT